MSQRRRQRLWAVARCALVLLAFPSGTEAQGDATTLLRAARAQIEEFNYDSAYKLLARVLNTPDQPVALVARTNTLFALNELNRTTDGKAAARGAFLEALRLQPLLNIDSLTHLHSDARAVFVEALDLAPPVVRIARSAALASASAPRPAVASTPAGDISSKLPARVVRISDRDRVSVMQWGFVEPAPNIFDRSCASFIALFWTVMGFDMNPNEVCDRAVILSVQGKAARRALNYTSIVRRRNGVVEVHTRPSPDAEWFNESTGKRLRLSILGEDKFLVTDLTPIIVTAPMPPRRAEFFSSVSIAQDQLGTHNVIHYESRGAPLPVAADSLPLALRARHAHRSDSCDGSLAFDGDLFRYEATQAGGHTFRFSVDDLVSGSFTPDGASLMMRAGGAQKLLIGKNDWNLLYAALVTSLRR